MKKIFNILMIAAVALGAVACQNDINDDVTPEQNGESVSITVSIAETRVALTGDTQTIEGKTQYKLGFEEGDELYVTPSWSGSTGFYFTYDKQVGDEYIFTCTAEGVSAIVGTEQWVAYLGGKKQAEGAYKFYCDTAAESVKGVVMVWDGTLGVDKINFRVAPMLKFKSNDPVTVTASAEVFRDGSGKSSYTTKTTGEYVYLPLNGPEGDVTFTFSIYGQEIGKKTISLGWTGNIYNFGEIEAPEVEKDVATIAIDGAFTDWEDVKINVATLPVDATTNTVIKTLKAYADATNIYVYGEITMEASVRMGFEFDLDNDSSTGDHMWMMPNVNGEFQIYDVVYCHDGGIFNWPMDPAQKTNADVAVDSCIAQKLNETTAAFEFSVAREHLNASITTPYIGIGVVSWGTSGTPSGMMPHNGSALIIPVE